MPIRHARWLAAIGLAGLASLGLAYWLTRAPAPSIQVRWRADVSSARQVELERKYWLAHPHQPDGRTVGYDLLDTRHENILALVRDPEVDDTSGIDRGRQTIQPGTAISQRSYWIADRVPGLRDARVQWTLIAALAVMVVAGIPFGALWRALTRFLPSLARATLLSLRANLVAIVLIGLAALSLAYWLNRDAPPSIRVRWRDDVSSARQAELERKYGLVNPHEPDGRTVGYDLLDPRREIIGAIVFDPEVADTNGINRGNQTLGPRNVASERLSWLAHRVPVLRDLRVQWTQWTLFVVLAAVVTVGILFRALRRTLTRWRTRYSTLPSADPGDFFDRLAGGGPFLAPPGGPRPLNLPTKILLGFLLVMVAGVPILETWKTLCLMAGLLALVFGVARPERWRLAAAASVVLAVMGLKAVLPRADIAEAHNPFLVIKEGEVLQIGLPAEVFRSWKAQSDALYPPPTDAHPAPYQWRDAGVPTTLFAASADAIWRKAKYSRQVDAIDFRSLGEFRGGFANESPAGLRYSNLYNFWNGALSRDSMPFYVMYELTAASAGSRLAWKGQVFWERGDGTFEEVVHSQVAARSVTAADAGRRVYAVFLQTRDGLAFRLEPSRTLQLAQWADALLTLGGGLLVLALTMRVRWGAYLRALVLTSIGYLVMVSYLPTRTEYLGKGYPPHRGGDDGMVHEGYGRAMAMLARRGEIVEALKGAEPVYWFMPGARYFRMVEKLVFGDTNHLYALMLACLPLVVFYLLRHFVWTRWAWVIAAVFCLMPVGNFSFLQYVTNARLGYGEALGGGLFLLGLALLLRTQPAWGGTDRNLRMVWTAGAALAASMFVRPNFVLAVLWLGAAYAWASWRRQDLRSIVTLAAGLGLALWMPFHNWYYGGQLYFLTKSGEAFHLVIGPRDYLVALSDVLRGRFDTHATAVTSAQFSAWLLDRGFIDAYMPWLAWAAHVVRIVALIWACRTAFLWLIGRPVNRTGLGVIAVAALCALLPMLFIRDTFYRYAMLGWDLSVLVLIVWLARAFQPQARAWAVSTVELRYDGFGHDLSR